MENMGAGVETNTGDVVAAFLDAMGMEVGFGIISVHNIPVFDAVARRGRTRLVMTRGEAGASHMADAHARATGSLGLLISSTGPGAANAVAGLVEARAAGTPLLHLTGQVSTALIERGTGTTHDVPDQLGMLRAVCKTAYRIRAPEEAWAVLCRAACDALSVPTGPVSVEIPIDVQKAHAVIPTFALDAAVVRPMPLPQASPAVLDALAERVLASRRPMLWVGSGARHAGGPLRKLLDLGMGMVSSWAGRGIVPEDHPRNLGGLNGNGAPRLQAFYRSVDLMVVVGSRLRGQETTDFRSALPDRRIQIDADPAANGRTYANELFVLGDCAAVCEALWERIASRFEACRTYVAEFEALKRDARADFRATLGPYHGFAEALRAALPRDALWVRDITVANSTWGNRLFELYGPRDGMHPVAAGIGVGLPFGVGAALAARGRKTVVLHGDAGFMMNVSELWTAMQERLDILFIVMNDAGYGVIRHMQDAAFGGRRVYGDLMPPDFKALADAAGARYLRVGDAGSFGAAAQSAVAAPGITLLEVDMRTIGEAPAYFPYDKVSAHGPS
jgi:acetolactate synthase-1/2/3 large subunit